MKLIAARDGSSGVLECARCKWGFGVLGGLTCLEQ